jgi:CheY-like chemotaxis protein
MEDLSTLIESIATILWPIIVLVLIIIFRKSVDALINSARGRKFTVKIGEMEVSMDEFSKQQGDMIKDLQNRVNELQRRIEADENQQPPKDTTLREEKPAAPTTAKTTREQNETEDLDLDIDDDISDILWVDDHPKNNAFLIDSLNSRGITVTTAETTQEAIDRFMHGSFDCIVSDTCRREGDGLHNCQAGFELASQIRELDQNIPVYIYTDKINARMKRKAQTVGATAITSSPSELLKLLSD